MTAATQESRRIHVEVADIHPRVAVDFEIRLGNKLDDQLVLLRIPIKLAINSGRR